MTLNGETFSNSSDICNHFANFFESMCDSVYDYLSNYNAPRLYNKNINVNNFSLLSIDIRKSCVPDKIAPLFLNQCAISLVDPFFSVFATRWKPSYVIPIFNSGSKITEELQFCQPSGFVVVCYLGSSLI